MSCPQGCPMALLPHRNKNSLFMDEKACRVQKDELCKTCGCILLTEHIILHIFSCF